MSWLITPRYLGAAVSDADAQTYLRAVEAADEQALEQGVQQAVNQFVIGCKADGIWDPAVQLLLFCGARTLAGATIPLKGATPINQGFLSGNYDRKLGLGDASNTSKYVNTNVPVNVLGSTSHALFAYGNLSTSTGDRELLGRFDGSTSASVLILSEWQTGTPIGRAFRSGTFVSNQYPVSTSTSPVSCLIGSRTSSTSASLYFDASSVNNSTNLSLTVGSSAPIYAFGINSSGSPGGFNRSIIQAMGIFSVGLTATEAASLRSRTSTLMSAISAAIP